MKTTRIPLALRDVRVLDFSQNLPGPYATMVLASLGAEVIKVEPPRGEPARNVPRLFEIVNVGKKGVVVDLKRAEDRARIERLLPSIDVVVEGFRPGVMAKFGLDADRAMQLHPRLVYCSISGYGQSGPYRDYPGHDLNYQALSGVCHMQRDLEGIPHGCSLPIADLSSAMTAVTSILAALRTRDQTGRGQVVDVAMVDTVASWAYVWSEGLTPSDAQVSTGALRATISAMQAASGRVPTLLKPIWQGLTRELASDWLAGPVETANERLKKTKVFRNLARLGLHAFPNYAMYKTKDRRFISLAIVDEQKFWRALCEGLDMSWLASIPAFGRLMLARPLRMLLARRFAERNLDYWMRSLDRHSVPITPVLSPQQAVQDPAINARRPAQAHLQGPWPLVARPSQQVPGLGEHNDEVFREPSPVRPAP